MEADSGIPNKNVLICPSVATVEWTPEQVWDTGFINSFSYFYLSYPNNNCAAQFATTADGPIIDPQTVFPSYTTHSEAVNLVQPYLNSILIAQEVGKPFYICGGFA